MNFEKHTVSHSELSLYNDCQMKWYLSYVKKLKTTNEHFRFGEMAHKVLETREIPSEELYSDLKEFFNITFWADYFNSILKELDAFLIDYNIIGKEVKVDNDIIRGIIDLVLERKSDKRIVIIDYKFSNGSKDLESILLDEQMYIYASLYCLEHNISINNVETGYINIPKTELDNPRILSNGKLSKDKSQNITEEVYRNKIKELNFDENDYLDILSELSGKRLLQIYIQPINIDMLYRIIRNVDNTIKDMFGKDYVLEKCTFMCKSCPYLEYCKYGKEI